MAVLDIKLYLWNVIPIRPAVNEKQHRQAFLSISEMI